MTREETCETKVFCDAVNKAKKNGLKPDEWLEEMINGGCWGDYEKQIAVIFSHEFAKAFFGNGMAQVSREAIHEHYQGRYGSWGRITHMADWMFHLQQLVLEENPIKYLEQFLEQSHDH